MKIGILTHPQGTNYGGILQCYALFTFLRKMGYDPIVIRREPDKSFFIWEWVRNVLRFLHVPRYYASQKTDRAANIRPFVEDNLKRTNPIVSQNQAKKIVNQYRLDAVIVGSDQVWRADFALRFGYNYFLDFVPSGVLKIAYAASFGLNRWDYSKEQTLVIQNLLHDFSGISVREQEAITLCKNNLRIEVEQKADPTFLLDREDYDKICTARIIESKYVFVYWLGDKTSIDHVLTEYENEGYSVKYIGLREQNVLPSVGDWLSYIKNAELILTDSFHGCVFSLLYQRPLVVYENKSGGYGRIASLMNQLNIDVHKLNQLDSDDYKMIKNQCSLMQKEALMYLNICLS